MGRCEDEVVATSSPNSAARCFIAAAEVDDDGGDEEASVEVEGCCNCSKAAEDVAEFKAAAVLMMEA